jgi:cystathionine beta-lyase
VWRASTHLYDDVAALDAGGDKTNEDGRFFYGRRGAPTQWSLAEALTELEPGAHGTMLYPSGVAAISRRAAVGTAAGRCVADERQCL